MFFVFGDSQFVEDCGISIKLHLLLEENTSRVDAFCIPLNKRLEVW